MKAFFKLFPLIENKSDSSTLKFNLSHCWLEYLIPCQRDEIPGSLCRAEYTKSFSGSSSRLMLRCFLTKPTWSLEVCSLCIAWAQKALPELESWEALDLEPGLCTFAIADILFITAFSESCLTTWGTVKLMFFPDFGQSPFSWLSLHRYSEHLGNLSGFRPPHRTRRKDEIKQCLLLALL